MANNINSCSAHYGSNEPVPGQPWTSNDRPGKVRACPSYKPTCEGYKANQSYGKCITNENPLQPALDAEKKIVSGLESNIKKLQTQNAADLSKIGGLQNTIVQDNKTLSAQTTKITGLQTNLASDQSTINYQEEQINNQLDRISGLESETHELTNELISTETKLDETRSLGAILALNKKLSLRGVNDMKAPLQGMLQNNDTIDTIASAVTSSNNDWDDINNGIVRATSKLDDIESNYDQVLFEKQQKQILIDTRRGMLSNEKRKNTYNTKLIMFIISINIILLIFIAIMYIRYMR